MGKLIRKTGKLFSIIGVISLVWLLVSLSFKDSIPTAVFVGILLLILGQIFLHKTDSKGSPPEEPLSPSRRESQRKHKSWIDNGK
ncbi:MAG: hypothetical protein WA116_09715 [Anaerolineaceae bacterium]